MKFYEYISCVLLFLILWFKTDAFVEYVKLFRLSKLFKLDDFENKKHEDFELTYHSYLRQYHNNFFTRLITCPICLSVWLCLPTIVYTFNIGIYCFHVLIVLSIYYLLSKLINIQ